MFKTLKLGCCVLDFLGAKVCRRPELEALCCFFIIESRHKIEQNRIQKKPVDHLSSVLKNKLAAFKKPPIV